MVSAQLNSNLKWWEVYNADATQAIGNLLSSIGSSAWCSVMTYGVRWWGWEGGSRGRGYRYTHR